MWAASRRHAKETSLTPTKHTRTHRRTASLMETRPNITLMKWNHFLEKYHSTKQLVMVTLSNI